MLESRTVHRTRLLEEVRAMSSPANQTSDPVVATFLIRSPTQLLPSCRSCGPGHCTRRNCQASVPPGPPLLWPSASPRPPDTPAAAAPRVSCSRARDLGSLPKDERISSAHSVTTTRPSFEPRPIAMDQLASGRHVQGHPPLGSYPRIAVRRVSSAPRSPVASIASGSHRSSCRNRL
jgi:hypothetical protein